MKKHFTVFVCVGLIAFLMSACQSFPKPESSNGRTIELIRHQVTPEFGIDSQIDVGEHPFVILMAQRERKIDSDEWPKIYDDDLIENLSYLSDNNWVLKVNFNSTW